MPSFETSEGNSKESPGVEHSSAISDFPSAIGRYRVERLLGEGAFGRVYQARDDHLNRAVAIKVPRRRVANPEDAASYLAEARTLAGLDHPHIVPVYDAGTGGDGRCFVVSKLIDGSDLATSMGRDRHSPLEAAEVVAAISEALHHAHRHGIVHRDIKPGNILIDQGGKPYLADFGLALKEEEFGKGPEFLGTPAYMSPEQARGEGHRVDGRSDIFSLGVVFYELLTGRLPFSGDTLEDILQEISQVEARPPRQIDDAIPRELERICLKALSKRSTERYTTALDLAEDLRHWLSHPWENRVTAPAPAAEPTEPSAASPPRIIPKGLRAFDAHDAAFFLDLLPGPRNREGIPESIAFWKNQIEERDPDQAFRVGLIYGPSGCGKSSLVKAGLLPRLSVSILSVYVESTPGGTESRLLRGLHKRCPGLPAGVALGEAIAALRRGRGIGAEEKVLIVLDQFEQWLHARRSEAVPELVAALRQSDGGRVQCLVLLRDDFWLAAARFFETLEVPLLAGQNTALVDLFDPPHARKVLSDFGRSFGRLGEGREKPARDPEAFLDEAVAGLSEDGRIVPVRLALFAEMVKGKPWTPAALKELGGAEGVGVTYLEESFSARTAHPRHRLHLKAARSVLQALLPETGTDIRGNMRSHRELLESSGYGRRPEELEELLRILDGDLRLLTPTDPEGLGPEAGGESAPPGERYYQLTHDYLVPSLREWLERKRKETRRGRAELRLSERAALWTAKPLDRHLPAWWEVLAIRCFTPRRSWTDSQRKMMRRASQIHARRGAFTVLGLALLFGAGYEGFARLKAQALIERLRDAGTNEVPGIVQEMGPYRSRIDPLLRDAQVRARAEGNPRRELHASLALLPDDPGQVDHLYARLLQAAPEEAITIRKALSDHGPKLIERLWTVVEKPGSGGPRLAAACALAAYDPESERWKKASVPVARDLAAVNPLLIGPWLDGLRPVKRRLIPSLLAVFRGGEEAVIPERRMAAEILSDLAADDPAILAELLLEYVEETQLAAIYPKLEAHREHARAILETELKRAPQPGKVDPSSDHSGSGPPGVAQKVAAFLRYGWEEKEREGLSRRQAIAAALLLKLGWPAKVWPLLQESTDPSVRSYIIHSLKPVGVDPGLLVSRLEEEKEPSSRRALLLALGELKREEVPGGDALLTKVLDMYRNDPDPGIHGAAAWLLRRWKGRESLKEIDRELATGKVEGQRRWYLTKEGQTMVIVQGPLEFEMGSPLDEVGRENGMGDEPLHRERIPYSFAVSAYEVTVEEFHHFKNRFGIDLAVMVRSPDPSCPILAVTWFEAAAYCNWLSEKEGLPEEEWCYLPNPQGKFASRMRIAPNALERKGYRLPTDAEWECAARAGTVSSRYYGRSEELLEKYAWYGKNSADRDWPVGSLKPNDWGLFDVLGNLLEWSQDRDTSARGNLEARGEEVAGSEKRRVHGGSFFLFARLLRSAFGNADLPGNRTFAAGFRPVRTLR